MAHTSKSALPGWRLVTAGLLLLVPLLTVWNMIADELAPNLIVRAGSLRGVVEQLIPVPLTFDTVADRRAQKEAMREVSDADPLRPMLIRISNQVRLKLFGAYGAPGVIAGENGQLIEEAYVNEYCRRDLAVLERKAHDWIPKLKALQDQFERRGATFIYLITPSKMAHMPEAFLAQVNCPSTPQARAKYVATYTRLLREAGIRFVDLATLTHSLKGRYEIDIFPPGGVHWNALGVAHAADAVLAEINRDGAITPRLQWTYRATDRPTGSDRELVDLINVLFPRARYATANVTFAAKNCADFPISKKSVAVVGGSFIHALSRTLLVDGCLRGLSSYNYLYRGRRTGPDYKIDKDRLTAADIEPLANVDVVLLEENEQVFPGSAHAEEFYRVLTQSR